MSIRVGLVRFCTNKYDVYGRRISLTRSTRALRTEGLVMRTEGLVISLEDLDRVGCLSGCEESLGNCSL